MVRDFCMSGVVCMQPIYAVQFKSQSYILKVMIRSIALFFCLKCLVLIPFIAVIFFCLSMGCLYQLELWPKFNADQGLLNGQVDTQLLTDCLSLPLSVHFRYVVFHPFLDEILVAKIKYCSQEGVHGEEGVTVCLLSVTHPA